MKNNLDLAGLAQLCGNRLEDVFKHYLHDIPSLELKNAMEYTLFNGGKRIRPLLIYATGCIFDAPFENLDIPASSVELIHTYSLIHDDLPAMDNADLRRGKPSCHKVYGEGVAVLTGDALHTLAMQMLANHPAPLQAEKRIQMMAVLSKACGPYGMAAGQALDITVMDSNAMSIQLLTDIYRLKTGALFTACIELGRLASSDDDEINQKALKEFGDCIGLAFQIQDDILDVEVETTLLGKRQGIDMVNNKITYPKLAGIDKAKDKVQTLYKKIDCVSMPKRRMTRLTAWIMIITKLIIFVFFIVVLG
jgi:farnesyl diphosphate synthase